MHGFAHHGGLETLPSYRIETYAAAPGEYVLALEGEIDLAARSELTRELSGIADENLRCVVADLTAATFVDVATLGVLESAHERLRAVGVELRLACTNRHLLKILRLTGVDLVLDVYETVSEAFVPDTYSNVIWLRPAAGG